MNPDQLKKNIIAMENQGAKPDEIQAYIDSVKQAPAGQQQEGSVLGDMGRALIKTPLRIASSFAPALEGIYAGLENLDGSNDFTQEDVARRNVEGRDFGAFGKNIKPMGWQASDKTMNVGEAGSRMGADIMGSSLELASYAMAPLRGATSFLGMLGQAATSKATASFVGGEVLKDVGDKKTGGQVIGEGAADYAGSTVATAIFGRGGALIQNWGARLLGSEASQTAYKGMQDVFNRIFNVSDQFPSGMKDIDEATRSAFMHNLNSEKRTFDGAVVKLKNSFIERMQPTIQDSSKVYMRAQEGARTLMREIFDDKNAKYAEFGIADVPLEKFSRTKEASAGLFSKSDDILANLSEEQGRTAAKLKAQGIPDEEISTFLGITSTAKPDPITGLAAKIKTVIDGGASNPGVILKLNREILDAAKVADDGTAEMLRETAHSLFADTSNMLRKAGRDDLMDLWNDAWQGHKKALDLVTSKMYRSFINSGEFDTFFSKFTAGKLENEAQEKFFQDLVEKAPSETRDLILDNVMRKLHKSNPQEGVQLLDAFLGEKGSKMFSFAKSVLNNEDLAFMYGMKDFLDYKFDDALLAAKVLKKPVQEAEQSLVEMMRLKGRIDVREAITTMDVDSFGQGITDLFQRQPELVGGIISQMSPNEKQMTRFSMLRRVFDSKMPAIIANPDGSGMIDETFVEMAKATINDVVAMSRRTGSKNIYGLFEDKQVSEMKKVLKTMVLYDDLKTVPPSDLIKLKSALFATFYGIRGWIPGAIANTQKALTGITEDEQLYYQAVQELSGKLKGTRGSTIIQVGDFMKVLTDKLNISPALTTALEGATTNTDATPDANTQ